ncbi:MAG: HlyD family efflux transporter periplasmic adaptor subunit [Flavobacteriales bacterium]|nr:HlyD family efflux transporter periplasmic adaptor subunit [Flavobacteriales bacterium]
MLNISKNSVSHLLDLTKTGSEGSIYHSALPRKMMRWLIGMVIIFILFLFLPWTQNIQADGYVTNLRPEQRPQVVNSVIAGRIEKWYIQEGQFVNKGDTILFISEVKDEYFDPNLLTRTKERLIAQEGGIQAYIKKIDALDQQVAALKQTQDLKIQQAKNKFRQGELKVKSDSLDLQAATSNIEIAEKQYERFEGLYEQGLKSLTEVENYRQTYREAEAKFVSAENKLLTSRNELLNAKIELTSVLSDYNDKIAKSESEKFTALSDMLDAEGKLAKTLNEVSNYTIRSSMYFITAPQDGFITKALQSGLGETIKEGDAIVSIVPNVSELAVEMYVRPIDLPLISTGSEVRFIFDGWPSLVFSGWPDNSVGTYSGKVMAIDNVTSDNGKYRILVAPNTEAIAWPKELRMGSGAQAIALLQDVPIWYEIWRQMNGFPPEFYNGKNGNTVEKK